ncbi:MAG: hypothetical protein FWF46_08900 [Oscillospiraceae bacterium]|nr:hypothetical protein [Oscillospiraceae bacterium]
MRKSTILFVTIIIIMLLLSTIVMATSDITQIPDISNSTNLTDSTPTNGLINSAITTYDNTTSNEANTLNSYGTITDNMLNNNSVDTNTSITDNSYNYDANIYDSVPSDLNTTPNDNAIPVDDLSTSDTSSSSGLDTASIINIFMIVVGIVIILLGFAILIRSK